MSPERTVLRFRTPAASRRSLPARAGCRPTGVASGSPWRCVSRRPHRALTPSACEDATHPPVRRPGRSSATCEWLREPGAMSTSLVPRTRERVEVVASAPARHERVRAGAAVCCSAEPAVGRGGKRSPACCSTPGPSEMSVGCRYWSERGASSGRSQAGTVAAFLQKQRPAIGGATWGLLSGAVCPSSWLAVFVFDRPAAARGRRDCPRCLTSVYRPHRCLCAV
jgi:hypothetical protein